MNPALPVDQPDETGGKHRKGFAKRREKRPPVPLDPQKLNDLALHYVARFASSRAKLETYLVRKLRERGWAGEGEDGQPAPDIAGLADRLVELGYVNDAEYARMKARSLGARGYGGRRVAEALHGAGIGEEDCAPVLNYARSQRWDSALRYARRKRFGPYGSDLPDRDKQRKQTASMLRAGHDFDVTRIVIAASDIQALELLAESGDDGA